MSTYVNTHIPLSSLSQKVCHTWVERNYYLIKDGLFCCSLSLSLWYSMDCSPNNKWSPRFGSMIGGRWRFPKECKWIIYITSSPSMTNLMRSVRRVVAEESLRWVMPCQELTDLQIIGPIGRLSSGPKERFGFPSKCIDGGLNHLWLKLEKEGGLVSVRFKDLS